MIPEVVKIFLLQNKEKQGYFCLQLSDDLTVKQIYGKPQQLGLTQPYIDENILNILPGFLPEMYKEEFEIPFYNLNENNVCNIYFINESGDKLLIFVDKSEIFQVTQKYQQFAHEDNISKNKFKRIAQELEQAKQSLKKSNQEKATLIAMLSHELGTPLTSILGYCELLLEKDKDNHNLKTIHRNSVYLQHLIENTLLFGKTEVGSMATQIETVDVSDFLASLVDTILPAALEKDIFISSQSCQESSINIDVTRTKQILINLLNNAIKYSNYGSVVISCNITCDHYEFLVSDTGIGIDEEQKQAIFNPWERVNKNDGKGSGIGLFISQKLANAIGGQLRLKESTKNIGSVFQLVLPASKVTINQVDENLSLASGLQGKTLLVIDDDQDVLDLIEAFLEKTQLNTICALSFLDAQSILLKTNVDLVLTDLNVGTTLAPTFLEELRNNNNNISVVLMSAMPSKQIKNQFIENGFKEVMSKPFNYNKLLSTIITHI